MQHAQKLQKIFPVAEGDHAQGPSCSVEREYCPHCPNKQVCTSEHVVGLRMVTLRCSILLERTLLETFQRAEDLLQGDRFVQNILDGKAQSDLFFRYQGDHNHRHLAVGSFPTDRSQHLPAAQVGQQQVQGNHIEATLAALGQ